MKSNIIKFAVFAAKQSKHRFRVGAVLYSGNRVLRIGTNSPYQTHPKSPKPYKNICAEFDAVLPWLHPLKSQMLKGLKIYVHRLKMDGSPGLAKPCEHCMAMLVGAGMKEKDIYFSLG